MTRTLVTGATGTVGNAIVCALLQQDTPVRALVRNLERARQRLPTAVELVEGDLTHERSVREAVAGCEVVYHAAGLPEQWLADASIFEAVNVGGTRNIVSAVLAAGARRLVYTSTIDVFAFEPNTEFDERRIQPDPMHTPYERSKQAADRVVTEALDRGLDAVFLHPSGVYGPAPAVLPGVNDLLARLAAGKIPMLLPGGLPVVFAPDVARGHLLAAERAACGERFILSESYVSLVEVAQAVATVQGHPRIPPVLPTFVARIVSECGEAWARISKKAPLIPRGQLHFLCLHVRPSAARAREQLGWQPVTFEQGIRQTMAWLDKEGAG